MWSVLIDALNGPLVASMADSGMANRLPYFPLERWGRRAPLIAMGAPVMLAGPTLMWLVPSRARSVVNVWHALCYVLMVNGNTVVLQSYLASLQELFPTGEERALAIARQTPFMLFTYVLTAAPVVLAFSSNPDMGKQCCISRHTDCSLRPSCACFANSSVWAALPSANQLDDLQLNSTTLYHPVYATACASGYLGVDGSSLSELASARAAACAVSPIPYGRFAACAALTCVMGLCVYLAVPPARTSGPLDADKARAAGSADEEKDKRQAPSLLAAILTTFRSMPFVCYTVQGLLATTWSSFVLANFALYLIYIADVAPAAAVSSSVVIGVAMVSARVTLIPVYTRAILRFPHHAHPARVLGYLRLVEAALTPLLFWALKQPSVDITALLVIAGLLIGVCSSPYDMCNHMLIGWAIDEDQVTKPPGAARHEGMFYACNGAVQHLSQVIISGTLTVWGTAGYDAAVCPNQQPQSASAAIEMSFMLGLPCISVLAAVVSFLYPIQGERLRKLKAHATRK